MEKQLIVNSDGLLWVLINNLEIDDIGLYLDFLSPILLVETSINNYLLLKITVLLSFSLDISFFLL